MRRGAEWTRAHSNATSKSDIYDNSEIYSDPIESGSNFGSLWRAHGARRARSVRFALHTRVMWEVLRDSSDSRANLYFIYLSRAPLCAVAAVRTARRSARLV